MITFDQRGSPGGSPPGELQASTFFFIPKISDAVEVANVLRGRGDSGACAFGQLGMNLVGPLGPDLSAAALGEFFEVPAALLDRAGDGLVAHEQAFQRLLCGGAVDVLVDGYPDRSA